MKIATYNAASVRARLPLILWWLEQNEPDVLCIQETKVEDDKFPMDEFHELGYEVALNGQKAWNGVATLSRIPIDHTSRGFGDDLMPEDARILTTVIGGIPVINTYVPNGNTVGSDKFAYKLKWLERFRRLLAENYQPEAPLIWLGDINIAPKPEDVFDSKKMLGGVGHHPDEFVRLAKIVEFGLVDLFRQFESEGGHYTYWDFVQVNSVRRNTGWRIDHIYATEVLAAQCRACKIDRGARTLERPSDHTFVVADFDL
ncbi:MAG: exodeoxyribonuclease III [Fimbriimonas sp.]